MPNIFDGDLKTATLSTGDSDGILGAEVKSIGRTNPRPITGGYIYFESDGGNASTFSVYIRYFNGDDFMKWHLAEDDEGSTFFTNNADSDKAYCEFTLERQSSWKGPIFGYQIKIVFTSDVGDISFTKGKSNENFN